jgi:hypothetical protein
MGILYLKSNDYLIGVQKFIESTYEHLAIQREEQDLTDLHLELNITNRGWKICFLEYDIDYSCDMGEWSKNLAKVSNLISVSGFLIGREAGHHLLSLLKQNFTIKDTLFNICKSNNHPILVLKKKLDLNPASFIFRKTTQVGKVGLFFHRFGGNKNILYVERNEVPRLRNVAIYPNTEILIGEGDSSTIEITEDVWNGVNTLSDTLYKISFSGFWPSFRLEQFPFLLGCQIVDKNPDILICSVFGPSVRTIQAKKKVIFNAETLFPFEPTEFDLIFDTIKREGSVCGSLWCPYFFWTSENLDEIEAIRFENKQDLKPRFCSFVVGHSTPFFRKEFFLKLCDYKRVDSGGSVLNNIGGRIGGDHRGDNLINFYRQSKFVLCCENTIAPGYVTEKILLSFKAGAIPIYWGAPEVIQFFNPKSFINLRDFDTIESAIEKIKEIDNNSELYQEMLSEPMFLNGTPFFDFQTLLFGRKYYDTNGIDRILIEKYKMKTFTHYGNENLTSLIENGWAKTEDGEVLIVSSLDKIEYDPILIVTKSSCPTGYHCDEKHNDYNYYLKN